MAARTIALTPLPRLEHEPVMQVPRPKTSALRSIVQQWAVDGVGIIVAILFFIVVGIIVVVATASSKSPWDTVIAALAMTSQAGFAYMVYRLGREQYAFAQQVSERQHKIDMYPLRKEVAAFLDKSEGLIIPERVISSDVVEAFRISHLDINKLFSTEADALAFKLYETVQRSTQMFDKSRPTYSFNGVLGYSVVIPENKDQADEGFVYIREAAHLFTDLQNMLADEMRIR